MSQIPSAGIYLIIEFDWPDPITKEQGQNAAKLHEIMQEHLWSKESL